MVDAVHLRDTIDRLPSRSLRSTACRASAVSTGGLPIRFPSARARCWPGMLRSRMLLHSHSADGQGEVQQELVGGRGGIELPLGEDHQVDAGSVTSLMKRRPSTALRLMRSMALTTRVSPTCTGALQGLAVAPGARSDLRDDLVDAVLLELAGLGLQVALVLGGLADPGEADGRREGMNHRRSSSPRLVCPETLGPGNPSVKGFRRVLRAIAFHWDRTFVR